MVDMVGQSLEKGGIDGLSTFLALLHGVVTELLLVLKEDQCLL